MVNIIDLSGIIGEMEKGLARWLRIGKARIPKPFSCSYCMTHHIGLLYLLITGEWSLINYSVLLICCFATPVTLNIIIGLREKINGIINKIL